MKYAHLRKYLPLANSADEGSSTVSGRVKLGTVKKGTNVYLHSKRSPSCQCCKFSSRDAQEAEFKDNPQWIVTLSPGWGKVLPSPAEMFCWRQEKSVNISALTLRCTPNRSVTKEKAEDTNLNSNTHFDSCCSKLTERLSNEGARGGEDRSEHEEEERRMESIAGPPLRKGVTDELGALGTVVTTGGGGVSGLVTVALSSGTFLIHKFSTRWPVLQLSSSIWEESTPYDDEWWYLCMKKNYHIHRSTGRQQTSTTGRNLPFNLVQHKAYQTH